MFPDLPVFKGGTAVRATRADKANAAIAAAESHKILAQHANGMGNVPQILRQAQGVPILPQHISGRTVRSSPRKLAQEVALRFTAIEMIH